MNYLEEEYFQDERNCEARVVLNNLKLELATRSDNEHIGSGLGGNPTDYLFFLTHTVQAIGIEEGDPRFERLGSEEILFFTTKKPSMRKVREALTQFLEQNFPNRPIIKQEQLMNSTYMRLFPETLELKLFFQCLDHVQELVGWLDAKLEMQNKLHDLSEKECQNLAVRFLRERGLPDTYFEDHKDEKNNPMRRMLNRHPIWGAKTKAVRARYNDMIKQLISTEDNEKLEMVGAFPQYIALFAFRALVGIERIVALNLDKLPACKFLREINQEMDDKHEDSGSDE